MLAADTTTTVLDNFTAWAKSPFQSGMDVGGWFAFVGLIAAITVAWGIILKDLRGDI